MNHNLNEDVAVGDVITTLINQIQQEVEKREMDEILGHGDALNVNQYETKCVMENDHYGEANASTHMIQKSGYRSCFYFLEPTKRTTITNDFVDLQGVGKSQNYNSLSDNNTMSPAIQILPIDLNANRRESPERIETHRSRRRRGRPRLDSNVLGLNEETLTNRITAYRRRRRDRRLLCRGKTTNNCKSSSTTDLFGQ